jgi:two-component system chemotaxis sensor kinase CheA
MKPDALFLNEALENLCAMRSALLAFDEGECGHEQIQLLFRCAHSVKGGAAAFGLETVAELMHLVESFLDPLRRGRAIIDPRRTALLREAVAAARCHLCGDSVGARKMRNLIQQMKNALHVPVAPNAGQVRQITIRSSTARESADAVAAMFSDIAGLGEVLSTDRGGAGAHAFVVRTAAPDHELLDLFAMHVERDSIAIRAIIELAASDQTGARRQDLSGVEAGAPALAAKRLREPARMDTVDALDAVGEEDRATQDDLAAAGVLGQSQPDSQEEPVSVLFARLPPLLEHLSARLHKRLTLAIAGQDLRIDCALLQALADPLIQLVRNACDHGIEGAAARAATGKPLSGLISVSAVLEQGHFQLSVGDDGAGLSRQDLLQAARAQAIPVADDIDDQRLWQLVFAPGLSTADAVSDVSGRGVGMDVVRHRATALGGDVTIDSSAGVGTCVTISVPLGVALLSRATRTG